MVQWYVLICRPRGPNHEVCMKEISTKLGLQTHCIDMEVNETRQFRWTGDPYPSGAVTIMEGWLAELGGTYTVQIDGETLTVTKNS